MTAIAIWFNDEDPDNPSLWVAADSRVSTTSYGSYSTLTDKAVKIFTLPVVCRYADENGFYSRISQYQTYGYCFAGSTLFGQNTFLALMPLLSNLTANQPYIPSLEDVSGYIFNYLNIIFEKYKTPFETALFGWCPIKNKYYIFHYHPEQDEKHKEIQVKKIRKEIFTDLKKKDFVYLGCHRENIKSKIQAAFNGNDIPGRPLSRIPRYIIEDYIQDDNYPEIGGNLQLGIANKYGFKPFVLCKPRNIGQTDAYLSYLGDDLHQDLKSLGYASVGLFGI